MGGAFLACDPDDRDETDELYYLASLNEKKFHLFDEQRLEKVSICTPEVTWSENSNKVAPWLAYETENISSKSRAGCNQSFFYNTLSSEDSEFQEISSQSHKK